MDHKRQIQTQQEFFEMYTEHCPIEFLAEKSYVVIHTLYLKKDTNIEAELKKVWQQLFGKALTEEAYNYVLGMAPVMLRSSIIEETRSGKGIRSLKFIARTVVALEFDLWLVEKYRASKKLVLTDFETYIREKYGSFLEQQYRSFKRQDLRHIDRFDSLAQTLDPYHDDILAMFDMVISNNHMKLVFENENAERVRKKVSVTEARTATLPPRAPRPEGNDREYQIILNEKEERIAKLENDIKEYKRQRDEAREYSANQYERGIKDLFGALNDVRYGKVIDYLYSLLRQKGIDDNLASYLDNLFMAFEDMEIEPIVENGKFHVKEDNLVKEYNLEFDKSEYNAGKVELKYAGWKYKDIPLEKPTLALKSDKTQGRNKISK